MSESATGSLLKIFAAATIVAAAVAVTMYWTDCEESASLGSEHDKMLRMETVHDFNDERMREQYTGEDNVMSSGDVFRFKVAENPTTGYSWQIDHNSCPDDVLNIESSYSAPDATAANGEPIEGAGGQLYVSLTALGENTSCTFQAAYARPWEFSWGDNESWDKVDNFIFLPIVIN